MPKFSIYLKDEVFELVEAERAETDETLSKTIARLVVQGSKYEVVTIHELREKQDRS